MNRPTASAHDHYTHLVVHLSKGYQPTCSCKIWTGAYHKAKGDAQRQAAEHVQAAESEWNL